MNIKYLIIINLMVSNVMCQKNDSIDKKFNIDEITLKNFENKLFLDTLNCQNHFSSDYKIKKFKNLSLKIPRSDSILFYKLNNFKVLEILDDKNINNTFSLLETKKAECSENYLFESFKYNILSNLFSNNLKDFGSSYMENLGKIYWAKVITKVEEIKLYDLQIMFIDKCDDNLFLINVSSTKKNLFEDTICNFHPIIKSIRVN